VRSRTSLARSLGALLTGPGAFLVSGAIDVVIALRLGLLYLWRSTIRSRWASGKAL
jgi:hypothetical protein